MRAERRRRRVVAHALAVDLERQRERLDAGELLQRSRARASARAAPPRRCPAPARRECPRAPRASAADGSLGEPRADRRQQRVAVARAGPGSCAKRGSSASSGRPMRSQSCAKSRSLAAAIISSPSAVGKTSYGRDQREGRAEAARRVAGAKRVGQLVADEREAGLEERRRRPRGRGPSASRSCSAATMPSAAHTPVPRSMSDVPTRTPGRSGSPVTLTMPGERLHQRVVARLRRASGPSRPKAPIEQ